MMTEFGDDLLSNCGNCFGRLWRVDGWLWKGRNAAMIPGDRTLADSKLGVDLFRGSASLELYRGSSLQVAAQRLQKIFIYCLSKEKEYMAIYRASKP